MIRGSCLCGGVRFEITRAVGPFELCHCSRCRKANGSAFVGGLGVKRSDFRLVQGRDLIETFEAPVRQSPPPYRTHFCRRCGSPVPDAIADTPWLEVPAASSMTIRNFGQTNTFLSTSSHPGSVSRTIFLSWTEPRC